MSSSAQVTALLTDAVNKPQYMNIVHAYCF